jgi:peroxin-16
MALVSYSSFVRKHSKELQSVESSLRSLSYLLPGRFKDAELASEASKFYYFELVFFSIEKKTQNKLVVYTFCNVFNHLNTNVLGMDQQRYLFSDLQPSPINKYTLHLLQTKPFSYSFLAYTLSILRMCQVFSEMIACRLGGENAQWRTITVMESVKQGFKYFF